MFSFSLFAFCPSPSGQSSQRESCLTEATMSARMLVLSCLVAVAAALQPSQMLSTRSAQVAQRTPAPEMKRPDYFLRVSRSEAGRPRLCVFRWAFAATTGPGVGRIVLVSCTPSSGPLRLRRT